MAIRNCAMCGDEFEANSGRALYCVSCRRLKQIERNKAYAENRKTGNVKTIGSVQECPFCGDLFTKNSGSQTCCFNCRVHKRYIKGAVTVANASDMEAVVLYMPTGTKDRLLQVAKDRGMSLVDLTAEQMGKLL